jgi:hypothetical protein
MATRIKRTYNLSPESVEQVRRLAGEAGLANSQDGIIELAIERLYREVRNRDEAAAWTSAAHDQAFQSEVRELDAVYGAAESSPE